MNSPKYFDIHSHLNFPDYEKDWEEVVGRLRESQTHTICVGTDLESSKKIVGLSDKYPEIYACLGVHPVDDKRGEFNNAEFEKLINHPKVVAIGECGLDFFHEDRDSNYERQKNLFLEQIEFAVKHDKPLMIHSRNTLPEILDVLEPLSKSYGEKLRGDVHFFAGSIDEARRFFNIGFTISFTGVITFARDYDEVIKFAPIEMIMSETDAPFVAPVPYRGKRNEPSYVIEVVKKIAEIRDENLEVVEKALIFNTKTVFGI